MKRMTWLVLLAAAALATTASGQAPAQTYPNGTIKIDGKTHFRCKMPAAAKRG